MVQKDILACLKFKSLMNRAKMSHWHLEEQKRVKAAIIIAAFILVILVLEMLLMELPAQELPTLSRS